MAVEKTTQTESPVTSPKAWIGYVIPMIAFVALTQFESWQGSGLSFPVLYTFKIAVVTATLVMARKTWKDIQPGWKMLGIGLAAGLLGFVEWVCVDPRTHHFAFMGSRSSYNPFVNIHNPAFRILFLIERFYGLVLLVPVMEELFWRSFLLRWITNPDFMKIRPADYSLGAFAIVALGFGFEHPEWLAALIYAAAIALLLKQTKSLFACVVMHSVTNLLLGIYVIRTGNWQLW